MVRHEQRKKRGEVGHGSFCFAMLHHGVGDVVRYVLGWVDSIDQTTNPTVEQAQVKTS